MHTESLQPVDTACQLRVDPAGALCYVAPMNEYAWDDSADAAMAARLKAAREAKGFSLAYVAGKLKVSKATVGHWETASRAIKHNDLAAFCKLLDVSADEVLFGVKRWPFEKIDFQSVSDLNTRDKDRLEGALVFTAAQLNIEIKRRVA